MTTTQITVDVTEEDIAKGKRHSIGCCPVALSCRRLINANWTVAPSDMGTDDFCVEPSPLVRQFIEAFDRGLSVAPFSFTLDVPTQLIKQ